MEAKLRRKTSRLRRGAKPQIACGDWHLSRYAETARLAWAGAAAQCNRHLGCENTAREDHRMPETILCVSTSRPPILLEYKGVGTVVRLVAIRLAAIALVPASCGLAYGFGDLESVDT